MGVKSNVAGFFYIDMDVTDGGGKPLNQIDASITGARHAVTIENLSGTPRHVKFISVLPNGTARIEYEIAGKAEAKWEAVSSVMIPAFTKRTFECALRRNQGPAGRAEPLQCDEVFQKYGPIDWTRLTVGVPFQLTIDVA